MIVMSVRIAKPRGALRFLLRLPIHLFHWKLGALLDHRFMLFTHRGRKSGRIYETVLEVVLYDRPTRTSFVTSGWGDAPDWYRNIQARPAVKVQVGGGSYAPEQHFLRPDEVLHAWTRFRRKHPIEERIALRIYSPRGVKYTSTQERRDAILGGLHMVSFRPRGRELEGTPGKGSGTS
jgi:deazaflavin-dependent oxidoreductase (nitroreductase family)